MDKFDIVFSISSEKNLNHIYAYLSDNYGIEIAKRTLNGIFDKIEMLEVMPEMYTKFKVDGKWYRSFRYITYKNFDIVFKVITDKKIVLIVGVAYCKSNVIKYLGEID